MACGDWRRANPLARVVNGDPRHSDHRPLIIDTGDREQRLRGDSCEISPKFEAKWLEEECLERVEKAWADAFAAGADKIIEINKLLLRDLHDWDRNVLGELEKTISKVKKELERCRRKQICQESVSREHLLRYKLERLQEQLNIYWKQRAHTVWLTKGDQNTHFFHEEKEEHNKEVEEG